MQTALRADMLPGTRVLAQLPALNSHTQWRTLYGKIQAEAAMPGWKGPQSGVKE